MKADTAFHDPYMTERLDADIWTLFDSGAAASCCPTLLPLSGKPPPLKSISGQPLNIYGRKLIEFELVGMRFYVCDVPYNVLSVS